MVVKFSIYLNRLVSVIRGLRSSLAEPLDSIECMNGEEKARGYFTHAPDDLNLRILRMFEGTSSPDVVLLRLTLRSVYLKQYNEIFLQLLKISIKLHRNDSSDNWLCNDVDNIFHGFYFIMNRRKEHLLSDI